MENYTIIDPSAIQHATSEQQRHRQFLDALEIVKGYCTEEKLYFSISRSPIYPESGKNSSASESNEVLYLTPSATPAEKRKPIKQYIYESAMQQLYAAEGPFNAQMLNEYVIDYPVFAGVTLEAIESAIKRAVHGTQNFERVEVDGRKGYIRPRMNNAATRSVAELPQTEFVRVEDLPF